MIEAIEQATKLHDKYQFEIKLDYELLRGKKTHYRISTYIFIPNSLGINNNSYTRKMFYRDVQNYIRLKTPILILRDFTSNSASPLITIERTIKLENWTSNPECKEHLLTSFKLLGAMLKSSIREHVNLTHKRITEATPNSKINLLIHNLVEEFLVETQNIADKFRTFYTEFNLPNVDQQVFAAYKFADESVSFLIEESAVEMFQIVEAHLKKSDKAEFLEKLSQRVEAETKHRKSHGYRSILKEGNDNEDYIFRASALKKYASSILYLSTAIRKEGRGLEHILFAVAAGLSMVFATIIAFYFQQQFGNFTFSFFIALVVGYMFKDRIKELGRAYFSGYLRHLLFDRRIIIRTLDGQHQLGILKEKVSFVQEKDIPRAVIAARNRDQITNLDNNWQGERVICYSKDITLFTDTFQVVFANMPEITGINDIMRYNIRAYLKKMAEPVQIRNYLENGQLKTIECHKVYYLNFVSKYTAVSSRKEQIYKRTRLVMDQEGIKRFEHVPT